MEDTPMSKLALKIVGFVMLGAIIGTLFGWEGWLSFAIGTVFADLVQPVAKFPVRRRDSAASIG
jgi:hypothetical protein